MVLVLLYIVTLQGMRLYSASRPLENNEAKTSTSCFFKSLMGRDQDINFFVNFFGVGQWPVTFFFFFFNTFLSLLSKVGAVPRDL
jgi:hypothetical protein